MKSVEDSSTQFIKNTNKIFAHSINCGNFPPLSRSPLRKKRLKDLTTLTLPKNETTIIAVEVKTKNAYK